MKRNILLLIGIVGLIVLEYGCTKEEPSCGGNSEMLVVGINGVENMRLDSSNQWVQIAESEVSYAALFYNVKFNWEMIAQTSLGNYAAYASVAPFTRWHPDSVLITDNGMDVTDMFTVDDHATMEDFLSEENPYHHGGLYIKLLSPPEVAEMKEYNMVFYSGDSQYKIITNPIIITP